MAYLRIKQSIENNTAGDIINVECNLTVDRIEKLSGIAQIEYKENQSYTISELMEEIFSQNISFIKENEAREYFVRDRFLDIYANGERNHYTE